MIQREDCSHRPYLHYGPRRLDASARLAASHVLPLVCSKSANLCDGVSARGESIVGRDETLLVRESALL